MSKRLNMAYLDEWELMASLSFYAFSGIIVKTLYKKRSSKLKSLNDIFIFKHMLWAGQHSMKIYVAHIVLYPLVFLLLTVKINGGL
ncbi:MAG: hypothetical protein LBE09_04640 [Christensenellaceae bacterium]|nr:hypothetical protein [Christensenellaceae bacterium]